MQTRLSCTPLLVFVLASTTFGQPELTITNGLATAKMYLPDAQNGYYRGARFDWSGVIHSLKWNGHEYFGEWQQTDDPYLHDRITGPVDAFSANDDVEPGETFLRVGTGVVQRRKHEADWPHPNKVIDAGRWLIQSGPNYVSMRQTVSHPPTKEAFTYTKRITLTPGKPELVIDHTLTNGGAGQLKTEVYNHNFFVIDDQPTGPNFAVTFPFKLKVDRDLKGLGKVDGNQLTYAKEIPKGQQIFALVTGFGDTEADNQFTIENLKSKAGVRVVTDRPMSKLQFWSPRTTLCPEPFVSINLKSNESDRWSIRYTFYSVE